MKIDLEADHPALHADFVWASSATGVPKETLILLAIKEGFPIARARYNWDAWGDDLMQRRDRLRSELRALKAGIKAVRRADARNPDCPTRYASGLSDAVRMMQPMRPLCDGLPAFARCLRTDGRPKDTAW